MFVVCFGDGLGNQMFQYAFYLAMKKHYPDNDVKMDIFNVYGRMIHNGFELDRIFNIERNECTHRIAKILSDTYPTGERFCAFFEIFNKIRRIYFGMKDSHIYQSDPTSYYEEVFELSRVKSYILQGNWINEKYFECVEEDVKKAFEFKIPLEEHNLKYAEMIKNLNSVSIHIRRGDFLSTTMCHLSIDYYKKCVEEIKKYVDKPNFFVFSDDKNYIKENFMFLDNYVIVEGNSGENSYRDMQLMSLCKHNIIANSTFSFWGAYLNKNENKVVIAPSKSSNSHRHNFSCKNWILINNK